MFGFGEPARRRRATPAPSDTLVAFRLPREGESGPSLWSRTIDRPGGRSLALFAVLTLALLAGAWALLRRRARIRISRSN